MAFTSNIVNFKFEVDPYILMSSMAYYVHVAQSNFDRLENAEPMITYVAA
jgi:hypothetical protein